MDLQQLRYFTSVASHGSISAAALALGITQPTISQALQALEHELRTPLFSRLGRGMVPTSAGYALLGPARRVLRTSAAARDSVRSRGRGLAGRLDVSIAPPVSSGPVARLLAGFLAAHKDVTLNARTLPSDDSIPTVLEDRQSDVVFTRLPLAADPSTNNADIDFDWFEVGTSEVRFASPTPGETLAEAAGTRRVLAPANDPYVHTIAGHALAQPTSSLGPPVIAERRETRLALLTNGVGSTFLGEELARVAEHHGIETRPLEPPLIYRIGMGYDPARLSDVATAFVHWARASAGGDSASDKNAATAGGG